MRRLFRKGERVRSKIDGKVMEVLKYITNNFVEVKWFDIESKEIRINKIKEDKLSKAAQNKLKKVSGSMQSLNS